MPGQVPATQYLGYKLAFEARDYRCVVLPDPNTLSDAVSEDNSVARIVAATRQAHQEAVRTGND
jgi:hypothetical protein